ILDIGTAQANVLRISAIGANPVFSNLSLFAQDTWKAGRDLTLTYGLRWELNPPPSVSGGSLPGSVISFHSIAAVSAPLLPDEIRNVPPQNTSYANFAPRFGISYRIAGDTNHETILRGGIGVFYDLGAGYASYGTYTGNTVANGPGQFPFIQGTIIRQNPTGNFTTLIDPEFKLPFTLRWSAGLERSLGEHQSISATYVAALGRRLTNMAAVREPDLYYPDYGVVKNEGSSDYHSLQLQYRRRLTRGLQILANHTWSHSIDLGSQDFQMGLERGSSDFDIRQSFSAAATYDLPALNFDSPIFKSKVFRLISHNPLFPKSLKSDPRFVQSVQSIFRNWSIDAIVRWQSALPFNPLASQLGGWVPGPNGEMLIQDVRPDFVYGIPVYIKDNSAPGGRRVNPEAFRPPPFLSGELAENSAGVFRQGTLGRNALRGYPFEQIDITFHRRFNIKENFALLFRADIFNLFNHSNFNNPEAKLYNIAAGESTNQFPPNFLFGKATSTVGGAPGNINTLYQIGGPRSIQLSLKLEF
ncbi:MAG: TonB-dependent receptor, partial [Blastocatellia bacterium]|nr:TonB-dependent receptor [Blastocatellia bacterium]